MSELGEESLVYKYMWRFVPLMFALTLAPVGTFVGVTTISRQGWAEGTTFLVAFYFFLLAVDWLLLRSLSDIRIDQKGIAREAFGITWQVMSWSDMEKITIIPARNPENGQFARMFVLRAKKVSRHFPSKKIIFQEWQGKMAPFLSRMMRYVEEQEVRVVDLSAG